MVAIMRTATLLKGKGGTIGILLLIMTLLLGVVAGAEKKKMTDAITSVQFDWDPDDPPLWTIRPEDRKAFLAGNKPALREQGKVPICEDHDRPAPMYQQFFERDCPAPFKFLPKGEGHDGTCEKWTYYNSWHDFECMTYCQVRTYFEWAQERPYPHSECHWPVSCSISESDSTSCGWSLSLSPKIGKALKVGVSGSWSETWGKAYGRSWSIDLEKGECGYFTFVPVKKVVCGTLSESVPGPRPIVGAPGAWYCDTQGIPGGKAKNTGNFCSSQLWQIRSKGTKNEEFIPDGTMIFVFTDCLTRKPLPMKKQDPIYAAPGVALDGDTLESIQQSWVWNTCYFYDLGEEGFKALFLRGSGFRDDQIGTNGEKLFKKIKACAGGDMHGTDFTWYDNGYPNDPAKKRGATWLLEADVPKDTRPGCIGEAIMELGGNSMDKCVGNA